MCRPDREGIGRVGSLSGVVELLASIPSPGTSSISLGPLTLRAYGLMIAIGVYVGVELGRRRWEARGGDGEDIMRIAWYAVPAGLIGSRIYHVATDWKSYQGRWLDALEIWNGGLGIPGGLIAGVGVGVWVAKRQGMDLRSGIDALIPGIPIAQAIGRLGNWFNQELFGRPSDLPWAVEIDEQHRPAEFADEATFHPTFAYEAVWNLLLAGFLLWLERKKVLKRGQILPVWIIGYGIGRFLVERVRIDPASLVLGLRVNIWMSGIAVLGGLLALWWTNRHWDDSPAPAMGGDGADADADAEGAASDDTELSDEPA